MKLSEQQVDHLVHQGFHLAAPVIVDTIHILGLGEDTYFDDDNGVFVFVDDRGSGRSAVERCGTRDDESHLHPVYVALYPHHS